MPMQRATKSELQALREIAWFFLSSERCYFCREFFIDPKEFEEQGFGHKRHSRIPVRVTAHHKDHDRKNNTHHNAGWSHPKCHRRYHAEERKGVQEESKDANWTA